MNSEPAGIDRTLRRRHDEDPLLRVRQAACDDRKLAFTSLFHHIASVDRLRQAFFELRRDAAPGTDGVSWDDYHSDLERNLQDLSDRLYRGAYRPQPSKRVLIPKAGGGQRPLALPVLEDKLVQRATSKVLSSIFEVDFLGFSYGFRPGRSQHDALDALYVGIKTRKVNWVLDADLRGFFETIDHDWLMKFVEHRIQDKRVLRLLEKWLHAGVLEDGVWQRQVQGTPQGGGISPLLANVYLHYALDLWVNQWRRREATCGVIIVRYADDFVLGFESKHDALRCREALTARLARFGLELHPDKTRLLEFGRPAVRNRKARGEGKPETFDFLGLTHICGRNRKGAFKLVRKTSKKKMRAKLKALKGELRRRMHHPPHEVGAWLRRVIVGHYNYYGVPDNYRSLKSFRDGVLDLWRRTMSRRSQKGRVTWERIKRLGRMWLPKPRIRHEYPTRQRLVAKSRGRSPVR